MCVRACTLQVPCVQQDGMKRTAPLQLPRGTVPLSYLDAFRPVDGNGSIRDSCLSFPSLWTYYVVHWAEERGGARRTRFLGE